MNETSSIPNSYKRISLIEILLLLWKKRFFIIISTILAGCLSVIIALNLTEIYKSQALVSIQSENQSNSLSSMASQFGGIASLAGISLSDGNNKTSYVVETIKSREFLKLLINKYDVTASIMATEYYNKETKEIVYRDLDWVRDGKENFLSIPSYLEVHDKYINSLLDININEKTGFINISIEHQSPYFAMEFLTIIIKELNLITKNREISETNAALSFLNEQLENAPLVEIKNSINNLIQSQLNNQMIANIKEDFLLKVLDPPYVPEQRVRPNRAILCISITLLVFLISIFTVLFSNFVKNFNLKHESKSNF